MSEQSSSSYGDAGSGTGTALVNTATSVIRWAPHGRALTACLVVVNVALVALVYIYFWRVFSRKRGSSPASESAEDEEDASPCSSTPASPPRIDQDQQRQHDLLVASLPTFVAEPRDGDEARALPRCGHRFHAACVDASPRGKGLGPRN